MVWDTRIYCASIQDVIIIIIIIIIIIGTFHVLCKPLTFQAI